MPPTRSSPTVSPYRPPTLANIPPRFRRKSLPEDELLRPDYALLVPPSPSLSPSLSMSMSSSPPSSPTALATSPTRPSHLDTAYVHQPSSPIRPTAQHAYGYSYAYSRAGSHALSCESDLLSTEHSSKSFSLRSHAYVVIPTGSTSSFLPPSDLDSNHALSSSRSESSFQHDVDDDLEDAYGFALDMDGILGASSPSRRVSFTTSSERDRPFVRIPAPRPVNPRAQKRSKTAPTETLTAPPALAQPENPRTPLDSTESAATRWSALPQDAPRRPSTPVRPRTRSGSPSARPPVVVAKDADDILPPSSPISSPVSSPLSTPAKDREPCADTTLPPSSPIAIPHTPKQEKMMVMDLGFDLTPSPPSPTLDALRITSRVSVRALLNPLPESAPTHIKQPSPEPITQETERYPSTSLEADGDITPFSLGEVETETTSVVEAIDQALAQKSSAHSPLPSSTPTGAQTPELAESHDIPSSPLSSPPRSVVDEHEVAIDVEVADDLPPSSPLRAASPLSPVISRAPTPPPRARSASMQRDEAIRVAPRKKARREGSPEPSTSRGVSQQPMAIVQDQAKPIAQKTDVTEEKIRPVQKPSHRKRRRVVWSDDETDSEADTPAPVPAPVQRVLPAKKKEKDCERKREKAKRPRVKDAPTDDVENEPLERTALAKGKAQRPSTGKAGPRSAAPTSATNLTFPDATLPDASTPEPQRQSKKLKTESRASSSTPAPEEDASVPPPKRARKDEEESRSRYGAPAPPAYILPLPAGELEGMLIETLATARASSLATSALYGALMAARPALREMALPVPAGPDGLPAPADVPAPDKEKEQEEVEKEKESQKKGKRGRSARADADAASRRAWVPALEDVLEAGCRRCGVFGKVVNCGTDTGDQALALEPRWFYDPERDEDSERATLVRSMMRRPGKRSETKKAKQYYWRPLPKISRWDPEDEL